MAVSDFLGRLPKKILTRIARLRGWPVERALERKTRVRHQGKTIFTMRNYGWTTEKRARTFSSKEPETLRWIDRFADDDILMDIGANVGIYSLYAASRGHHVIALEPDALNFALLNLNIMDNGFGNLVTAYPFSLHRESLIAELHMADCDWGGSGRSFGRNLDWKGLEFDATFRQGSAGISVDEFVSQTGICPANIKIDVDGNEIFVLEGSAATLADPTVKSILIELFDGHSQFEKCIQLIENAGFKLIERVAWANAVRKNRVTSENFIFTR
jgi:FkbM family methyltransferase